jgi:hypothetical protein
VPTGDENTVGDALLRAMVIEQVVESLTAGKRLMWDDAGQRWVVEMAADRWP